MNEKIEKIDEVAVDEVQPEETKQEAEPAKSQDKKYSDTDLNRIIAKEKAAWKRTADKDKESWDGNEKSLQDQVKARDEVIQSQVDFLKKDLELDEITLELLGEKDALEQYKMMLKIMDKQGKLNIPRTPKGQRKQPEFKTKFSANI